MVLEKEGAKLVKFNELKFKRQTKERSNEFSNLQGQHLEGKRSNREYRKTFE